MKTFKKFFIENILQSKIELTPFQKADLHNLLMTAKDNDGEFKANFQNNIIEKNAVILKDSNEYSEIKKMVPNAKIETSNNINNKYKIKIDPKEGGILYIFEEENKNPKTIIFIQSTKTSIKIVKEISFNSTDKKIVHEEIIWQPMQNDETKITHLIRNLS